MAIGLGVLRVIAVSAKTPSMPELLFPTGLLGLGVGGAYPALAAAVTEGEPEYRRASVYGAYRMWRDLGFATGGIVTRLFSSFAAEVLGVFIWCSIVGAVFLGRVCCVKDTAPRAQQGSVQLGSQTV